MGELIARWRRLIGLAVGLAVFTALTAAFPAEPARCRDGWHSPSIGRQGACSHHGGVVRPGSGRHLVFFIGSVALGFVVAAVEDLDRRRRTEPQPSRPTAPAAPMAPRDRNAPAHGCPRCGAPLRLRTARQSAQSGKRFWGCSRFPDCSGTRSIKARRSDSRPRRRR